MIKNSDIMIKKLLSLISTFLLVFSFPSWGIEKEKENTLLKKLSTPYNPASLEQNFLDFGNTIKDPQPYIFSYAPSFSLPSLPHLYPFHISNLSSNEEVPSSFPSSSSSKAPLLKNSSALDMLATTSLENAYPSKTFPVQSINPSFLSTSSAPSGSEDPLSPSSPQLKNPQDINIMDVEEETSLQKPSSSLRNSPSPVVVKDDLSNPEIDAKKNKTSSKKKKEKPLSINPIPPKNKTSKRKKIEITKEQLENCLGHLNQGETAEKLGISISTVKRRFQELFPGVRWPYKFSQETIDKQEIKKTQQEKGFFYWEIKDNS